ncbi:MAG: 16S rRNA (uracil(1498)-N(3))-methyltransferase [Microbacteriaceae bacterium]
MANLYVREGLQPADFTGTIEVTGDEARHAVAVSRLRVGESILVGNGEGTIAGGTVTAASQNAFSVEIAEVTEYPEPVRKVWIVQALAKGDRSERAVELCTEFGAWGFVAWQAARSISKWDAKKAPKGLEKWHRVAREASKQSIRPFVPRVTGPMTTNDLVQLAAAGEATVIVLHPRDAAELSARVAELSPSGDVYVCVGPEGGLSDAELEALSSAGAITVTVGANVLRTSSAGAAALSVLNLAAGHW